MGYWQKEKLSVSGEIQSRHTLDIAPKLFQYINAWVMRLCIMNRLNMTIDRCLPGIYIMFSWLAHDYFMFCTKLGHCLQCNMCLQKDSQITCSWLAWIWVDFCNWSMLCFNTTHKKKTCIIISNRLYLLYWYLKTEL